MSATVEDVRRSLADGECVLCVLSPDAFGIGRSLSAGDPVAESGDRPVLYWDAEDGFVGQPGARPEGTEDPIRALAYAEHYTGPAIFVFAFDQVDVAGTEAPFRRQLKSMAARFAPSTERALILISSDPLPPSIRRLCTLLGYPEEGLEAETVPLDRSGAPAAGPWREIRQLDRFDSAEWRERLERLTREEVQEIIRGEYHLEAVHRVNALRDGLKMQFTRKDDIIDMMAYATVAQVPMVLLGPPGTAKSNMVRNFCEGLGLSGLRDSAAGQGSDAGETRKGPGKFFEYLLTRYTTPEEIFGPVHIPDMIDKRQYRRVTTGCLPEAEVAFLDEIFKASSAIVNALLAIINERVFHNGGEIQRVPLAMVFAASNEPPQDPQLAALYDRFPLRANCGRVEDEHVHDLWERSWQLGFDKVFSPENLSMPRVACVNDFRLLHLVSLCHFGARSIDSDRGMGRVDFGAEFLRVFRSLRREYDISDRTLRALYALARAMAIVEGRNDLSVEDLNVFRYTSWDESGTGELDRLVSNLKRGIAM